MTRISHKNHPARDQGFLSRLHDGDLTPSERAHFENHRAHCTGCRGLAAEYENALSLFRSARSAPPPADMANRVLRKVQSAGRTRPTPAVSFFSVDWRWASGFAAALLVLLIAAPALLRQQSRARENAAPIPVALEESSPRSDAARNVQSAQNEQAPRLAEEPKLQNDVPSAAPEPSGPKSRAPQVLPPAPQSAGGHAQAQSQAQAQAQAPAREAAAKESDRRRNVAQNQTVTFSERPTDKVDAARAPAAPPRAVAGALRDEEAQANKMLDQGSRLLVQEADGLGSAPQLLSGGDQPAFAQLRGRSFVLVVDPSGSVSEVREAEKQELDSDLKRREASLSKEKDAGAAAPSDPLRRLQFAPSDRSRRVLLKVQ